MEDRLLRFEPVEMEGETAVSTGEYTPVCGISISGSEQMKAIYGEQPVGGFPSSTTQKTDLARQVMLTLINRD